MTVSYFKRYRMHFDLQQPIPQNELPEDYRILKWDERLLSHHAQAKYESFRNELDANVFPCLGDADGCRRLMRDISNRQGFIPEATWLIAFQPTNQRKPVYCGTVQGIRDAQGIGSIQNVGIVPEHRGKGLGKVLLSYALNGFRKRAITTASLEVTAENHDAFRLYWRFGFRTVRTVFKTVDVVYAS